jgi:hypothetical protein
MQLELMNPDSYFGSTHLTLAVRNFGMDLLGHLFGSEGCNVDGSIGSNPFTSLVDHVFDSNFTDFGQMPADNAVFVEESMSMYHEGPQQVLHLTGTDHPSGEDLSLCFAFTTTSAGTSLSTAT